ncbi:hypothetical protein ACPPVU_13735 [Mucilaginibacter sp. McL0603]|uniref:hypothetical protein n=1 Tax=Mucilaginibacter sp. McL0603 TaxID=3415670 RepID=UPI003CF877CB
MKKISALLLLFACLSTEYIFAQVKPHVVTAPDSLTNLASVVTSIQIVKLNESQSSYAKDFKPDPKTGSAKNSVVAYPNTIVHFTISNPMTFLKTRPNDRAKVIFYANGIELKGICTPWESGITDMMLTTGKIPDLGQTAEIYIQLKRNDTTQQAWNFLYANKPSFWDNFANVDASIGWEGMSSLKKDSKVPNVNIIFYYNKTLAAWLVLFAALLGGFVYLCFDTNTLHQGDKTKAYSLSLTQLMFWTILVIAAFIYTVILTDIPTSLNSSILIMLGISMGTTGTATLIDNRFKQNNQDISKLTKGFIQDLLTSDGESYSVQRIQSFAWNLVLGLYFITYTIANKSMPVFSSTLLFLAGISSASYVGTKVPENNDLKAQAAAQNNADNNAVTNKDNNKDTGATNQTVAPNNALNVQTTNNGAVPDNKINGIADQTLAQGNSSTIQLPNNGVTVIIPQTIIPETPQVINTNPQLTNNGAAQNSNTATTVQETQQNANPDPEINQETH